VPAASVNPESEWIAALRRGDERAFEELVRQQSGRLLAVARRYVSEEDARDAVQEGFLALAGNLDRFEARSQLGTWLHRIVVNACLMRLRKASTRYEESIEPHLPQFLADGHRRQPGAAWPESAELMLQRAEVRSVVRRAIAKLPPGYRSVLLLRDIEGLSGAEVAAQMDLSPGAVKVRLHRARQALRELLDPEILGSLAS